MKTKAIVFFMLACGALTGLAETTVGLSGALALPQGGSRMRRVGGAELRLGQTLSETWSLEGVAGWLEDLAALEVQGCWRLQGWSLYDDLFGYSRFDPFLTGGVKGWIGSEGQVGPKVGLGACYHLTDDWAIRADFDATLGLDSRVGLVYSFGLGLQRTF